MLGSETTKTDLIAVVVALVIGLPAGFVIAPAIGLNSGGWPWLVSALIGGLLARLIRRLLNNSGIFSDSDSDSSEILETNEAMERIED